MTTIRIELPEANTYGETMKGYLTLMKAFGTDLAATCSSILNEKRGNWWFQSLIQQRIEEKKLHGQKQDLRDAMIVLKEVAYEDFSPIHEVLAPNHVSRAQAKKIVAKRNELLHFGGEPSLDDIAEAAHMIQLFAREYGLATDGAIVPLLKRLQRIKRGQYSPKSAATPTPPEAPAVSDVPPPEEPPAEVSITAELPRPKIGGVWNGPVPAGEYRATKAGDLVSTSTGDSVRERITGDADAKIRAWLAPKPKGDIWIADDGAVGGYVAFVPRLLGYVGEEPPGEVARGFLLPKYFEARGREVADIDGGPSHSLPGEVSVSDGELLRLTTYGDLIRIDDDGVSRVAVVDPREWA